jgi:hypothetical protein
MTTELPGQRPEGKLIQDALKTDGRSIRQVAALAGISDARWRQLVKGSLNVGSDHVTEQVAPPATLARMAYVVGVTPGQLTKAGRKDAAAILVQLQQDALDGGSAVPLPATAAGDQADEIDLVYASKTMSAEQKLKAIRQILLLRKQAETEADANRAFLAREAEADQQS